jgi:hypothetical protein
VESNRTSLSTKPQIQQIPRSETHMNTQEPFNEQNLRITSTDPFSVDLDEWPRDVDLIISALHAAGYDGSDRRHATRRRHRVVAQLRLFCDLNGVPHRLFVRDCCDRHLGFITSSVVPLGFGGTVELVRPDHQVSTISCVVRRCRECVPGWYEGTLHFNRAQIEMKFPD